MSVSKSNTIQEKLTKALAKSDKVQRTVTQKVIGSKVTPTLENENNIKEQPPHEDDADNKKVKKPKAKNHNNRIHMTEEERKHFM